MIARLRRLMLVAPVFLASACASSSSGPVEPIPSSGAPIPASAAPDPEPQASVSVPSDELPPPPPPPPAGTSEEPESPADDDAALKVPLDELMALAVYAPEPDQMALQQTKAARVDKVDGTGIVSFCVDRHGKTTSIQTVQKFPDDPMVDKIFRDTIERWRFRPWQVDGQSRTVCTERRFTLRFK